MPAGVQFEVRVGRDTLRLSVGCDPIKVVRQFCEVNGCPERTGVMLKSLHAKLTRNYDRLPNWQREIVSRMNHSAHVVTR